MMWTAPGLRLKGVLAEDALTLWRDETSEELMLPLTVAAWVGQRERRQPAFAPYVLSGRCGWRRGG
jgi:hypothetical protein